MIFTLNPTDIISISIGFLICLLIFSNRNRNIIYSLWNQVDLGMQHQSAQLIFLLGVTTYGTDLV